MTANSTELFETNLHLPERIAKKFMRFGNHVEYDDLYQEALIGLDHASKTFDSSKSDNFERFAIYAMYNRAMRWLMYKTNPMHIGRHIIEIATTINKRKLADLAPDAIAKEINKPEHYVVQALDHLKRQIPKSVYETVTAKDGSSIENSFLIDTLYDNSDDPYNPVNLDIKTFFSTLNPREKKILEMRMNGLSQEEISPHVGISQMQISREIKRMKGKYAEFMQIS